MRQLGLFEHQDLKEFTKRDSECEISGEGGTSAEKNFGCEGGDVRMEWQRENDRMLAEKNFRMQGRSDGMVAGGIPGAMCPDGMVAEEFRMRYVRVEWRRKEFPDAICPSGMAAGGILDAICPDGMNVVMSSMKDRYGLYGYEGLGEWF